MEEQLLSILGATQSPSEGPRRAAEEQLARARLEPGFPLSLATIASHASVAPDIRQGALVALRTFVDRSWSGAGDEQGAPAIPVDDGSREQIRAMILALATGDEEHSKVRGGASSVVSKMAASDFPEQWPALLPTLLALIQTGGAAQVHGSLKLLADLLDDALSDEQFFSVARDIVKVVYDVAVNGQRSDILRALAVSCFRGCFDIMDMVKEEYGAEVKGFADEVLAAWLPLCLRILKSTLPARPANIDDATMAWRGIVALKLQVVKTLMKIRSVFPQLLLPQSPQLFTATWEELSTVQALHKELYIDNDVQGRLEDVDGLPYTLDFLVLEELDFLQQCLRAPPVQKELEGQLQAHGGITSTPWVMDVMKLAVGYALIGKEEEDLWDVDVNLFISEETSVTANYTARTACGDLLIKLGEWLDQGALEGLLAYAQAIYQSSEITWREREAALYLVTQLLGDFLDVEKKASQDVARHFMALIEFAVSRTDEPLLCARAYLVASVLVQIAPEVEAVLLNQIISSINGSSSEVVRIACVKSLHGFIKAGRVQVEHQAQIITAISDYLSSQDLTEIEDADDLLVTLLDTLRAAIGLDCRVMVADDIAALDLLFLLAKHGASRYQVTAIVLEAFEDVVTTMRAPEPYAVLCAKVLPLLTSAFDVGNMTENNPLVELAADMLNALVEEGPEPLPAGFAAAVMPKLARVLLSTEEGGILRPGVETLKHMLSHDHQQVFSWHDENNRSGLAVSLLIVDRLLGPDIDENAASEIGGLTAEVVEKAGHERLGPYLEQLLKAVATRLATATAPHFLQSLILVFARLSIVGADDVVQFLNQLQINNENGLQVVLSKWLENSINFAGYDEIRQNVIALSKIYALNSPLVANTTVKGDLIIPTSSRIITRSQSKANPDQYTMIPAPLKLLKVLISELLSASGGAPLSALQAAAAAAAAGAEFVDEDGGEDNESWEDVPNVLDLNNAATKRSLMDFGMGGGDDGDDDDASALIGGARFVRQRDDETQAFLEDWFVMVAKDDTAGFKAWWPGLSDGERAKLEDLGRQVERGGGTGGGGGG